ncbi:hypothetical protein Bcell_2992 [Evansella cellulosilytica DSM 2522]|uniref:Uncharacterized protein n=2 Tax=Evansella TaxID=2837485 RepID=E6TY29_EVAC2|nr:hypothetical protein Bcell_2992 [Evansella cellulosilytica DSM 2522]
MRNAAYYYDLCCKHRGKFVKIYCLNTRKEYVGKIVDIDRQYVWLEPSQPQTQGHGFGYGWGWGAGLVPISLAAIGGFALGTAFFW